MKHMLRISLINIRMSHVTSGLAGSTERTKANFIETS
jgi:hypothetical protein